MEIAEFDMGTEVDTSGGVHTKIYDFFVASYTSYWITFPALIQNGKIYTIFNFYTIRQNITYFRPNMVKVCIRYSAGQKRTCLYTVKPIYKCPETSPLI